MMDLFLHLFLFDFVVLDLFQAQRTVFARSYLLICVDTHFCTFDVSNHLLENMFVLGAPLCTPYELIVVKLFQMS